MSQVVKAYFTVFLIFLGIFSFLGILIADADVNNANDLHSDIVNQIQDSNFSSSVIASCKSTVANHTNYELAVNEITDENGNVTMCEVILSYDYSIPFFNLISSGHEIRSIVR